MMNKWLTQKDQPDNLHHLSPQKAISMQAFNFYLNRSAKLLYKLYFFSTDHYHQQWESWKLRKFTSWGSMPSSCLSLRWAARITPSELFSSSSASKNSGWLQQVFVQWSNTWQTW